MRSSSKQLKNNELKAKQHSDPLQPDISKPNRKRAANPRPKHALIGNERKRTAEPRLYQPELKKHHPTETIANSKQ